MDKNIVKRFFNENKGKFSPSKQKEVYHLLLNTDEKTFNAIEDEGFDDPTIVLLASVFVGYLGVGRFMMGDRMLGLLKLISTLVIVTLWYIVIVINNNSKESSETVYYITNTVAAVIIGFYWFMDVFSVLTKSKQHNFNRLKSMIQKANL